MELLLQCVHRTGSRALHSKSGNQGWRFAAPLPRLFSCPLTMAAAPAAAASLAAALTARVSSRRPALCLPSASSSSSSATAAEATLGTLAFFATDAFTAAAAAAAAVRAVGGRGAGALKLPPAAAGDGPFAATPAPGPPGAAPRPRLSRGASTSGLPVAPRTGTATAAAAACLGAFKPPPPPLLALMALRVFIKAARVSMRPLATQSRR